MSEFPDDIMATASWVAAHRLDLSKEAGQQIVRLIAHSLNDERTKAGTRIAALEAENERLRKVLTELHAAVWGECPSLLNEDSGGDARLDLEIRDALEAKP